MFLCPVSIKSQIQFEENCHTHGSQQTPLLTESCRAVLCSVGWELALSPQYLSPSPGFLTKHDAFYRPLLSLARSLSLMDLLQSCLYTRLEISCSFSPETQSKHNSLLQWTSIATVPEPGHAQSRELGRVHCATSRSCPCRPGGQQLSSRRQWQTSQWREFCQALAEQVTSGQSLGPSLPLIPPTSLWTSPDRKALSSTLEEPWPGLAVPVDSLSSSSVKWGGWRDSKASEAH